MIWQVAACFADPIVSSHRINSPYTGAPGSELPVGDPWLVHLPTTLVRLRANDDLPSWKKDADENWVPEN